MKIKFTLLIGLLLSVFTLEAQELESSLLWKVSGNGLTTDSYLFGTLHATCKTQLKPRVLKALNETEQLALEIDLSDAGMQMKMMNMMYLKDNKQIMDYVDEEDQAAVKTFFAEKIKTLSFEMLNRFKPFAISSMLIPNYLDCTMPQAYDMMLMQQALMKEMEVIGLETVEDQMAIFDNIPIEEQITDLVKTAKDTTNFYERQFDQLVEAYDNENLNDLEASYKEDESYIANYNDEMLDQRNKNWIPIIEKMCKEKPSFIGFGALHLVGENGVIQLLRNKGYTVEAVMPE